MHPPVPLDSRDLPARTRHRSTLRAGALGLAVAVASGALNASDRTATTSTADDAVLHECLIEPHLLADVGSPVQGVVERVLVERGEAVTRGQALVQLESAVERAALDEAEARAGMLSEIASREADLELARLDQERFDDLQQRDLAPAQQRDEAIARLRVARAALVQAQENQKLALLERDRAQRLLARRTIRSPVDGVVVQRLLESGEVVNDEPLVTVAALDPLRIEVVLPGRLFGTVTPGATAQVFPEFDNGLARPARVEVVDALLDTRSGTFGVRLQLENPERAIVAGQRCRVAFEPAEPIG